MCAPPGSTGSNRRAFGRLNRRTGHPVLHTPGRIAPLQLATMRAQPGGPPSAASAIGVCPWRPRQSLTCSHDYSVFSNQLMRVWLVVERRNLAEARCAVRGLCLGEGCPFEPERRSRPPGRVSRRWRSGSEAEARAGRSPTHIRLISPSPHDTSSTGPDRLFVPAGSRIPRR